MDPDELAASITGAVQEAMRQDASGMVEALQRIAVITFARVYFSGGGNPREATTAAANFANEVDQAIAATRPDSDPEAVARMITQAAVNFGTYSAAGPGADLTWRTMKDERVRDSHVPMEGVSRPAGTPFMVAGTPMLYPGQPVGPPENWINCRCRLTVGGEAHPRLIASTEEAPMDNDLRAKGDEFDFDFELNPSFDYETVADEPSLVAVSDKPWSQFTASDYTIEQWRRACLLKMPDGDPESKSTYKLPVREPGGALNRNGVHAAAAALAGARGGVAAPAAAKAAARSKLRGLYKQLGETPPDSLAADASDSLVAVDTHDAPGWITNPRETQRLRTYWTKGEGAAKIGWGTPGDFNRCRSHLGKYVAEPYLAGTCANLHYVALGFWPATHAKMTGAGEQPDDEITNRIYDAFQQEDPMDETAALPPLEWFSDPGFTAATPATIDGDHYFGHLAAFGTCHVGVEGSCTTPPRSHHNYAYFRTGQVQTAGGSVPVGQITMDTGHAPREATPHATVRHYDDTGTVVADVATGEDDCGIWFNGMLRPGVTDEQRHALGAGAISGDWRRIAGNLELVAALVVNVPGFPIPRTELAASIDEEPLSLVAAAIVTVDPNAEMAERFAIAVVNTIEQRRARQERAAALRAEITRRRVAALVAAGG